MIKEVELKKVIHSIAMKNKDDLLMNDIDLIKHLQVKMGEKVLNLWEWDYI